MKVLAAFVVILGSVSALGSGPYLPSGWRPKGPAFMLPTETQKPAQDPPKVQEIVSTAQPAENQENVQETEASGSDFLREYGPPVEKDILKEITMQALPDLETERPFFVIDARVVQTDENGDESEVAEEKNVENGAIVETKSAEEPIQSTGASDVIEEDETTTAVEGKECEDIGITESLVTEEISEVTTAKIEKNIPEDRTTQSIAEDATKKNDNSNLLVKSDEETQVNAVGSLEYLPPALNEVEQENKETLLLRSNSSDSVSEVNESSLNLINVAEQEPIPLYKADLETGLHLNVDGNVENFSSVTQENNEETVKSNDVVVTVNESPAEDTVVSTEANQEVSEESSGLEPKDQEQVGFREYGPPKSGDDEQRSEASKIESNETRRRRFSSKFAPAKKH